MTRAGHAIRRLAVLGVVVTVLGACGGAAEQPVPTLTAGATAPDRVGGSTTGEDPGDGDVAGERDDGRSPEPAPTAVDPSSSPTDDEPSTDPTDAPSDGSTEEDGPSGPSSTAIATLVGEQLAAAGEAAQHVVADLDDDGSVEVVLASVQDDRVAVEVWWWRPGRGFGSPATVDAGRGRTVTELRATDLTEDGTTELLVGVGGGARDSLAVFTVASGGEVVPREAVGGCFAGSHVYGATSAFLQARPDGPPAIVATCDDSPLPVADWSTAVYEFREGAYRWVRPPAPEQPVVAGDGVGDGDDGVGDGDDGDGGEPGATTGPPRD